MTQTTTWETLIQISSTYLPLKNDVWCYKTWNRTFFIKKYIWVSIQMLIGESCNLTTICSAAFLCSFFFILSFYLHNENFLVIYFIFKKNSLRSKSNISKVFVTYSYVNLVNSKKYLNFTSIFFFREFDVYFYSILSIVYT